jgi:hypothetical protein
MVGLSDSTQMAAQMGPSESEAWGAGRPRRLKLVTQSLGEPPRAARGSPLVFSGCWLCTCEWKLARPGTAGGGSVTGVPRGQDKLCRALTGQGQHGKDAEGASGRKKT